MLKIIMIHPFLDTRGGAERKVAILLKELQKWYSVELMVHKMDLKNSFHELIDKNKVRVVPYGSSFISRIFATIKTAFILRGYDLIIAHNFPANVEAALSRIMFGPKVIYFCNEPIPFITRNKGYFLLSLSRAIDRFFVKFISIIITNSSYTQNLIKQAFGRKSYIIYSGIEDSFFKVSINNNLKKISFNNNNESKKIVNPEKIKLVSVGRFNKHKNFDFLIEMMDNFPDAELYLGGAKGDYQDQIEKKAKKYKNIIISYPDTREKIIDLYSSADIILFSPKNEPLGMIPMEGMAVGKPVVAFNSGGPRETIKDKETGLLSDNEDSFIANVRYLIDNPRIRVEMGKKGRQRAKELFSIEKMIENTRKQIEKLI